MSRGKSTTRLPQSLQKELGVELQSGRGRGGYGGQGRKEQRRSDRVEKRQNVRGRGAIDRARTRWHERRNNVGGYSEDLEKENRRERPQQVPAREQPKSILKGVKAPSPSSSSVADSESELEIEFKSEFESDSDSGLDRPLRELSPEIVLDASSRAYKDRLAEDEDEILKLERKLGRRKKKTGKAADDDGLGDLLGELDSDDEDRKRKLEGREWLARKRRRREEPEPGIVVEHDEEGGNVDDSDGDADLMSDEGENMADHGDTDEREDDAFSGFESDYEDKHVLKQATRVKENPYLPGVVSSATSSSTTPAATRYIPPSLRKSQNGEDQSLERLKRQIQGHLNKLSEANLVSILNELESIYRDKPRQDVTSTLIDLLLSLFCNAATLNSTFVLLHAAFSAAIYKVIGADFGAELLARLVNRFELYHSDPASNGKESLNLISLLCHLFTFHLTSSNLVYAHINLLLSPLSESNTELLLRVIRDCGPQLRSDDPSALKNVVSQTQASAQLLPTPVSVRTQFMLEIITDLKNNKMRDSAATSALTREHITKLRKTLGSLNSRTLRATEPLRLTLDDLLNSDRRGKWWLVGASWKGRDTNDQTIQPTDTSPTTTHDNTTTHITATFSDTLALPDHRSLASTLSLPSPLHLSLLTALTSATTPQEAILRLSKLRLKRAQEPELARVLLRCCGAEQGFNPYYSDIVQKLCSGSDMGFSGGGGGGGGGMGNGKRWKKIFEFGFWGFCRRVDDDDADADADIYDGDDYANTEGKGDVTMNEIFNTANLFSHLVHSSTLTLVILRPLDLLTLPPRTKLFMELLFVNIFILCKQDIQGQVQRIFGQLGQATGVVGQVRVFLKRVVRNSDFVGGGGGGVKKKEREGKNEWQRDVVRRGVKVAVGVLDELSIGGSIETQI